MDNFVASIGNTDFNTALNLLKQYSFTELRLDLIDWNIDEINTFFSRSVCSILTFRDKEGIDRLEFLEKIDWSNIDYVDIDLSNDVDYKSGVQSLMEDKDVNVIWSHHDFQEFVSPKAFISKNKSISSVDYLKLACTISSEEEAEEVLNSYGKRKNLILIGMGEKGKRTRQEGVQKGSAFMYGFPEELSQTAPGQVSVSELERHYYENFRFSALIGKPAIHSKSPHMFNGFYESNRISASYSRIATNDFEDIHKIRDIIPVAFFNVTSPYKYEFDHEGQEAKNYIKNASREWEATNTDVEGIRLAIESRLTIENKSVLIVGSGGAAEAAIQACAKGTVSISSRNEKTTDELLGKYPHLKNENWERLKDSIKNYDIVVWTIPAIVAEKKEIQFNKNQIILDANYKNALSEMGLDSLGIDNENYIPGKEWLIHQAVPIMKELYPESSVSIAEIEASLSTDHLSRLNRISLIGLPASGKSSIAKELAEKLERGWIDIDEEIVKEAGMSISEIFEKFGERHFRNLEQKILFESLKNENTIISTGGGVIGSEKNRSILKEQSFPIWLIIDPEVAAGRTSLTQERPLISEEASLKVRQLHIKRYPAYADLSELCIFVDNKSIEEIRDIIYEEYNSTI